MVCSIGCACRRHGDGDVALVKWPDLEEGEFGNMGADGDDNTWAE